MAVKGFSSSAFYLGIFLNLFEAPLYIITMVCQISDLTRMPHGVCGNLGTAFI